MLPSDKTRVSGGNNTTEPRSDKNQNGRLSTGEQVPFMSNQNSLQSLNVANDKASASVADKPISDISGINYSNASTKQDAPKPKNKGLGKTLAFGSLSLLLLGGVSFGAIAMVSSSKHKASLASATVAKTIKLNVPVQVNQSNLQSTQAGAQTISLNGDVNIQGSLTTASSISSGSNISAKGDLNVQGNIYSGGNLVATTLGGNGSAITNLNASNLTTGQIPSASLPANVTLLGQTIPLSAIQANIVSSVNGITNNGGDIQIVGNNVNVVNDSVNKTITLSLPATVGTITGVTAGTGLTGGGTSGNVTVAVDGTVTVQGNTFNGANELIKLDANSKLPVADGSNLTNLNGANIQVGSIPDAALSNNVCLGASNNCNYQTTGNYVNLQSATPGSAQIGNINISGTNTAAYFSGDGSLLSNINASNVTTGTINNLRLSNSVTLQGNSFNGANQLVQTTNLGYLPVINGSNVTSLNASSLASGTVSDSRLSTNVALQNANNIFSGNNTFSNTITTNGIQSSTGTLTVGSAANPLTLQGSSITIKQGSTNPVTYTFSAGVAGSSYEICTTLGNCGTGSSTIVGSGTANKLTKFTGNQSIGNSSISDDGSTVTLSTSTLAKPTSNSTSTFVIQNASASSLFTADTTNMRIGIGNSSPVYPLDVTGNINSSTGLYVNGNKVCDSTGCGSSGGSGFYIQNGTSLQTNANFNIQSSSSESPVGVLQGAYGQSSDLLDLQDSYGTNMVSFSAYGDVNILGTYQINGSQISSSDLGDSYKLATLWNDQVFHNNNNFLGASTYYGNVLQINDSSNAFQIQNSAANTLLNADTVSMRVGIGTSTPGYTLDVNGDVNIASGSHFKVGGVNICSGSNLCAPSAGSNYYVQNSTTIQASTNLNIQSASAASVTAVLQGASAQTADILDIKSGAGNIVAGFNNNGQLNLGKSLIQNGMLTLANSTNNNVITLQPASSGTGSNIVTLPNETGQICTTAGSAACTAVYAAASGSGSYVNLQGSTPGTVQTGSLNISGTAIAASFSGGGASLTSLNGTNITSGTVASTYLPNNITYQGNSFNGVSQLVQTNASGNISIAGSIGTASALYTPLLDTTSAGTLSIGTSNASSITLGKASQGQVSIPGGINTGGNSISTGGGSISTSNGSLNLGTGTITTSGAIQGGAISGTTGNFSSTLGVTGLLTANGGITTNNGNANFGTGTITSGAINGATISGGTLSNTGVGGSGAFTVSSGGSGSLNLSSGSGNVSTGTNTINGQTISSAANFTGTLGVTGTVTAASFSGNGASLTSLNGANIQGGTVANTALQNSSVTITNGTNVTGGGTVSLGGTLTVGTVNNPTFSTSVTTPILTSTGSLTISSASSTNLSLNGVTVSNSGAISNVSSLAASGNISTSAGSISGVGISAGTGSFTGTGGATISGATSINTTGSGSTNIGTGTNIGTTTIGNSSGGSTILQGSIGVNGTATFGNSANLVLGTGSAVSYASSSTANFDLSNSSGVFKTTTGAVTLQGSTNTINGVTNINTGSSVATGVNIGTGSTYTGTISIANGSGASTVNIGNSSSTLNLQGSTNTINGATSINASANNNTNINTGNSTGQVNIGNSSTSSINITSGSTGGITLNGGSANSTLVLQGTNANLNSYAICTALSSTCNSTYQVSGNYAQLGSSNTFTGSNNTLNATSSNALTVQNTSSAVALNVNTSNNSVGMNGQLSVPTGVTAGTPTSGGTLAASTTYTIEVTALDGAGNQTTPSTSTTKATTASNKTIPVSWNAVTNAISYNVYYSSNGGTSWAYYNVSSGTSYSLAASSGTSATPPSFNSAFVNDFTSSTNSLTATKFYGQTSVTSSSASAFLVQANSSATLLLANNSTSVSNIGNGATSYTGQLFIGVQSTAFTGQFTGQRLYVDSAQITGTTLIGSYTGTATCDSSSDNNSGNYVYFNFSFEPYLCGSARHSRQISYSPEYNDTVLSPSSGNTSGGSIITGYDSGNDHNYYQWSTSSSSTQGFDLYLHIHVPSDFSAWSVNSIGASAGQLCAQLNITGVSSPTVSASILTSAFNSLAPSSSPISFAKPQNNTWTSTCVTIFPATVTANSYITVNLHLATDVNSNIKLGELYIPYASKF